VLLVILFFSFFLSLFCLVCGIRFAFNLVRVQFQEFIQPFISLSLFHSTFASAFSCFCHFTFQRISLQSRDLGRHSVVQSKELFSPSLRAKDSEISNKKLFLSNRQQITKVWLCFLTDQNSSTGSSNLNPKWLQLK
jgi:hypothetical protein